MPDLEPPSEKFLGLHAPSESKSLPINHLNPLACIVQVTMIPSMYSACIMHSYWLISR